MRVAFRSSNPDKIQPPTPFAQVSSLMLSGLVDLLLLDSSSNEHVLAANLVLLMLHEL